MSLLLALTILSVHGLILLYFKWTRKPHPNFPPGPKAVPILGSIPFLPKNLRAGGKLHVPKAFHYLAKTYGPVCGLHLGPIPTIVISDEELMKEALNQDSISGRPLMVPWHEFRHGGSDGRQRGVILSSGEEWKDQRRFIIRHLKDLGMGKSRMESQIQEEVAKLCSELAKEVDTTMDLNWRFNISSVNALWVILAGEKLDLKDERLHKIVSSIEKVVRNSQVSSLAAILFPTLFKILSPRYARARETFEVARSLMVEAIEKHHANLEEKDSEMGDFIECYLKQIKDTTDPDSSFYGQKGFNSLDTVLIDLFHAGSETTSSTMLWTILFLLHFPGVQDRIHDEILRVVGPDKQPELLDMEKMPYTKAVMHESLRVGTVVPGGVPHYVEQDSWVGGYFFPKGTTVMANLNFVHLNPASWEDPEDFKPERFLDSEGKFQAKTAKKIVPFSVGKRKCLGFVLAEQEYFLFLTGILQKFRIENPEGQILPSFKFSDDTQNRGFVRYAPKYLVKLVAK